MNKRQGTHWQGCGDTNDPKHAGCPKTKARNRAQCLKCEDIIESTYTHDFVRCKCDSIFVDGGPSYARRGWPGGDIKDWIKELP